MKKFSKILSVALLVALVLSLGVANAFAAEGDPAYSITITNAVEKETYTAYKMFNLSVDEPEKPTAFRYTVNSAWAGFADTDVFKAVFSVDSNGYISSEEASQAAWQAGSKMSDLADAAAKYAADHNIASAGSVTIEEGKTSGTISLDVPGYYVITSTLGSRAMLQTTPTDPAAQINEKNEGDTTEKKVQEDSQATNPDTHGWGDANDAQVGDTVNFKSVTTVVPRSIKVKIHDTMDPGLTLNPSSIKVYTTYSDDNDNTNDVEYTAAVIRAGTGESAPDTGDTFTIYIPDSFAATATASQTLTVVYTAELNKLAIVTDKDGNPVIDPATNDTHVTFGDHGSSEHDTTDTTTHKFMVYKHKGGETPNLADAVFQVKKGGTVVNLIKIDDTNYRVADDTETGTAASHANNGELNTVAAGTLVSDFVTVASGDITIWGVDADNDYTLNEIQPPKGYNALAAEKEVTVNADNSTRVDVENNTGSVLPSTGGIGTTIFYVVGGVLVLAAIILLVTKKRMSE